jgi:hypothetical protein
MTELDFYEAFLPGTFVALFLRILFWRRSIKLLRSGAKESSTYSYRLRFALLETKILAAGTSFAPVYFMTVCRLFRLSIDVESTCGHRLDKLGLDDDEESHVATPCCRRTTRNFTKPTDDENIEKTTTRHTLRSTGTLLL